MTDETERGEMLDGSSGVGRSDSGPGIRTALGPLVVASVYGFLLWAGWRRTADPLVDFGREAYTAWRLSAGDLLYRDLSSLFGPLAPYADAAGMALFGSSLGVLFAINAALIAVATVLIYLFVTRVARRATAVLASAVFLAVFAFGYAGAPNFDFLASYSRAAVWGVVAAVAAVVCFDRWLARVPGEERRAFWLFSAGVCVGLTLLTKPEISVAAAGTGFVAVALGTWRSPVEASDGAAGNPSSGGGATLVAVGGAALPLLVTFVGFGVTGSAALGVDAALAAFRPLLSADPASMPFYRQLAGLEQPWMRAKEILGATGWVGGTLFALGLVDRLLIRLGGWSRRLGRIAALAGVAVAVMAAGSLYALVFEIVPRATPLLLLSALAWCATRLSRGRRVGHPGGSARSNPAERTSRSAEKVVHRGRTRALSIWLVFSLLLLVKLGLRPRFLHYGFYLGVPAGVALTVVLVEIVPAWIGRRTGSGALVRLAGVGLLLLTLGVHGAFSVAQARGKDVRVAGGGDVLWGEGNLAVAVDRILERIEETTAPDATLVVVPEGASLNYWTRRENPTRHVSFMPPELAIYGSDRMIRALERGRPDFVVLWKRPLPDYGGGRYGDAPATGADIVDFVREGYTCVERIPVHGWRFDLELLERRDRLSGPRGPANLRCREPSDG